LGARGLHHLTTSLLHYFTASPPHHHTTKTPFAFGISLKGKLLV